MGWVHHHTIADQTSRAIVHHARGHELQCRLYPFDHQSVARVVPALESHHGLGVIAEPIDDFAFAFVAPLGANHHHVTAACIQRFGRHEELGARVHATVHGKERTTQRPSTDTSWRSQ